MNETPVDDLGLERFRGYLRVLALTHLRAEETAKKLDASDVVQHALLQAHDKRAQFQGRSDAELAGWLRQILANTLANAVRDQGRAKRDVGRECSLQAKLDVTSKRLNAWLIADQTSPSQKAVRREQTLRAAEALAELPEAQREVLLLRHCEGWSVDAISKHIGRGPEAVAGLLKRGLKQLREIMGEGT